ncbi:flagellar basal body-associated FliL family protein [Deferribacteraceae bacterium V6Fe1]|nr:flagellar basal body-associated FliL family protein [Deferribacteraceae bacterium V6Fe1]
MAEEKEVTEQEQPKKKSKFKLILIILIVLVLAGGGAAAYFLIFAKKPADTNAEQIAAGTAPKKPKADASTIGPLYSFDSFIVNLADPGGTRYLKVSMQAELDSDKLADEIEKRKPQIRDIILTVLSSKTYAEVSTAQGKLALKQEIMRRINLTLTSGAIRSIYFTEFVSQ